MKSSTRSLVCRERLFKDQIFNDKQLDAKVRTKLGRLTSHPQAIKTVVEKGKLTLTGFILDDEEEFALTVVSSICRINEIENKLEKHSVNENFPKFRGAHKRRNSILERKKNWSPQIRIVAQAN